MARLGLINVVAVAGKFSGTLAAARWHAAVPRRDATALALLMNTRGLTEMVILGIGLQVGLIDDTVYSLMVAMAVLTTAAAGPLLSRVKPRPVLVGSVSAVSPRIQPRRVEQADGLLVHSGRER
jgi:Kef-type K+ transport system membrane component KefB